MAAVTREMLDRKVGRLAKLLVVPHATYNGEEGLFLDYLKGAGYRVVLVDEQRGERQPFGGKRFPAAVLWDMIDFAESVVSFESGFIVPG